MKMRRISSPRACWEREHFPVHRADVDSILVGSSRAEQMPGTERILPDDLPTAGVDRVEHTTHASDEDIPAAEAESAVVDHGTDVALPQDFTRVRVGAVSVAL